MGESQVSRSGGLEPHPETPPKAHASLSPLGGRGCLQQASARRGLRAGSAFIPMLQTTRWTCRAGSPPQASGCRSIFKQQARRRRRASTRSAIAGRLQIGSTGAVIAAVVRALRAGQKAAEGRGAVALFPMANAPSIAAEISAATVTTLPFGGSLGALPYALATALRESVAPPLRAKPAGPPQGAWIQPPMPMQVWCVRDDVAAAQHKSRPGPCRTVQKYGPGLLRTSS